MAVMQQRAAVISTTTYNNSNIVALALSYKQISMAGAPALFLRVHEVSLLHHYTLLVPHSHI
jgi:hypothetical protein